MKLKGNEILPVSSSISVKPLSKCYLITPVSKLNHISSPIINDSKSVIFHIHSIGDRKIITNLIGPFGIGSMDTETTLSASIRQIIVSLK